MDALIAFVQVDQIKREEHTESMNAARRDDPKTLARSQSEPSDQPLEARKRGICESYSQIEKTFAREVVYAVRRSFHVVPSLLACPATGALSGSRFIYASQTTLA